MNNKIKKLNMQHTGHINDDAEYIIKALKTNLLNEATQVFKDEDTLVFKCFPPIIKNNGDYLTTIYRFAKTYNLQHLLEAFQNYLLSDDETTTAKNFAILMCELGELHQEFTASTANKEH